MTLAEARAAGLTEEQIAALTLNSGNHDSPEEGACLLERPRQLGHRARHDRGPAPHAGAAVRARRPAVRARGPHLPHRAGAALRRKTAARRYFEKPLEPLTCSTGKRPYSDFSQAKEFARRTGRQHDAPMQPYRCERCRYWHVGSHHLGHGHRRPRVEHEE
jgi:hypothetical protein